MYNIPNQVAIQQTGANYIPADTVLLVVNAVVIVVMLLALTAAMAYLLWKRTELYFHRITTAKIDVRERTMNLVSKELHANFSQVASTININLGVILRLNPSQAHQHIVETKALAKKLISSLSAFSVSLNTSHVQETGLSGALQHEVKRLAASPDNQVTFSRTGEEYRVNADHEIILFRLCQEILHYLYHTPKGFSIRVVLGYSPRHMEVCLIYQGTMGGEPDQHWLADIKSRARFINASFHSRRRPDQQTHFYFRLQKPAA